MYKVEIALRAVKSLEDIQRGQPAHARRVFAAIEELAVDPFKGKKLKGALSDLFSMRVGIYRVIYYVDQGRILVSVIIVEHRKSVYR